MPMCNHHESFWLLDALEPGNSSLEALESNYDIVIVGAGIAGISAAYWMLSKSDFQVLVLDHAPEKGATNRNCGHILHGTVENIQTMVSMYGKDDAKRLWDFSRQVCDEVKHTVNKLGIDCRYSQDGYLVVALTEAEDQEIKGAIQELESFGYSNQSYLSPSQLADLGLMDCIGARFEADSARANPVKFRNSLLRHLYTSYPERFSYCDHAEVQKVEEKENHGEIVLHQGKTISCEASILATNAYTKLISEDVNKRNLIEPFRGQIMVSKPLSNEISPNMAHSFDHGHIYGVGTSDNRLMIGGWRNHTPGETGTFSLDLNTSIEEGLKAFVHKHYQLGKQVLEWDYGWTGIMGSAKGGLPLLGPANQQRIFLCAGFTGHGFSWAHGSAKYCVDSLLGTLTPSDSALSHHFNPRLRK